jgi:hypothetical protein
VTHNEASRNELYHKGNEKKLQHSVLQKVSVNQNTYGMNGILSLLSDLVTSYGHTKTITSIHTQDYINLYTCILP